MSEGVEQRDVERILRDVLSTSGLRALVLKVERAPNGWHVMVVDEANRTLSTEIAGGRPAAIRAALDTWLQNQ
jgi:hypothetical protein